MKWEQFHHPGLSLPVVRRHASEVLLEMAYEMGRTVFHLRWGDPYIEREFRSRLSYNNAIYRLRKDGLVAYRRQGVATARDVSHPGGSGANAADLPPEEALGPEMGGRWHVLVYDVPETERIRGGRRARGGARMGGYAWRGGGPQEFVESLGDGVVPPVLVEYIARILPRMRTGRWSHPHAGWAGVVQRSVPPHVSARHQREKHLPAHGARVGGPAARIHGWPMPRPRRCSSASSVR